MRFKVRHIVEHIVEGDPRTMTGDSIKQQIVSSQPSKPGDSRFLFNGNNTLGGTTIATHMQDMGHDFLNETSLELVQEADQDFDLTYSFSGSLHQIRVNWKDSVLDVKNEIAARWHVATYVQFLCTKRRWLRDDQTLRDVLMFLDRPLELHIIFGKGFQMFVKVLTGKTLTFEMQSTDLVDELKRKLEKKDGVKASAQSLIYHGKQLQCGYMLADYGAGREATIHLTYTNRRCGCGCGQNNYVEGQFSEGESGGSEDFADFEAIFG